ncbi:MAG: GAF domain-containing protein [Anaerolineae bacterium]|nr:GAF domain-containing protein [Anaerolineae bacterium]
MSFFRLGLLKSNLSTDLLVNLDGVLRTAVNQMSSVFNAQVAITLSQVGQLRPEAHASSTLSLDEKEKSVARWAFENNRPAGRFTETLPLAAAQHLPLLTPAGSVGVLSLRGRTGERPSFDLEILLETFVHHIALVIQREMLDEAAEEAQMLRQSEKLYTTLLNTISHEFRTPLAAITGASSSLLSTGILFTPQAQRDLLSDIYSAAERLNRLVENLLDMSRLEGGRLALKRDWCDLGDLLGSARKRAELPPARLQLSLAAELPLLRLDYVLMEQVFINLLDNALRYAPEASLIRLEATQRANQIEVRVTNAGAGIPPEDLERVFDKFYRVPGTQPGGTGLGLPVSRAIVEAHGGSLHAERPPGGGACLVVRLPGGEAVPPVQEAAL